MNFEEAITAHSQWKIRLQGVISGTNKEVLDPQIVAKDDRCALGQWIHGEARKYELLPEYADLVKDHARFHRCAAEVLHAAQTGQTEKAKANVTSGDFHEVSLKTITAIRKLRKKVQG